jgi:uncharacterized repeat protein (TIGR01451 family)
MSRTRIVGGKITEIVGGNYNIYAKESIIYNAGTTITETAEGVISFGEPKDPPKREENTNLLVDIGLDIFVNEDGKEIGRVKKQGIKGKDKPIESVTPEQTDLAVTISIDNNTPEIGKDVKFTIIATNNGPETATRVTVEDILPSGYTFICQETEKGTWEAPVWTIGDLASGEKAILEIEATVKEGEYTSLAKIDGQEQDSTPANNSSKITTRVFLVKTIKKDFDSKAPVNGITEKVRKDTEQFIKTNNGIIDSFTSSCIAYTNTVEIEASATNRQAMVTIVEQDNGRKSPTDPNNNREFGGNIINNVVVQATPGIVSILGVDKKAQIQLLSAGIGFHSHPSGYKSETKKEGNVEGMSSSEETTDMWLNAPSNIGGDIQNASKDGRIGYVFARRNKIIYIYNKQGVMATIPHEYFVNLNR